MKRQVLAAFRPAPLGDRVHVLVRLLSCPFAPVDAVLPTAGRILDLGCGHGAFSVHLSYSAPGRDVHGCDIDSSKLAVAPSLPGITFTPGAADLSPATWDGIAVLDVLYLLGRTDALALVRSASGALAPGGLLAVKEISLTPRWKYRVARFQELLATRVLRITEGVDVDFVDPADIAATMRTAGLSVTVTSLHRRRLHPHVLITGTRP